MTIEEVLSSILQELKKINISLEKKTTALANTHAPIEHEKFLTIKEWGKNYKYPSEAGMRAFIFNAKLYNAEHCFKRVGRRVLINRDEFLKWIETNPNPKKVYNRY
jgi:hypothetical protein